MDDFNFPSKKIDINNYTTAHKFLIGIRPKLEQTGAVITAQEKQAIQIHGRHYG